MPRHAFTLPISLARDGGKPYKQQIVSQIEWLIVSGRLQADDRLPSIQRLTTMLGVARNTVLNAYECLTGAGLLRCEAGRGFFVAVDAPRITMPARRTTTSQPCSEHPPDYCAMSAAPRPPGVHASPPAAPVRFDFKVGRPAPEAFPWRRWATLSNSLLRHMGCAMTEYTAPEGLWGLRVQIADYLSATRALPVRPEQIIVVAGIQEALNLLAAHYVRPGTQVAMESPGYAGFENLLLRHDARCLRVPVDTHGLCTDALPETCTGLVYTTPSHQYPLGHVMSLQRRRALLAWAARVDALVIEDDYDGDFCYDGVPLPPLMTMDPSRVIYLGTFSKVLGPGLRLGFMACPHGLVEAMARHKALLNNGCPWLDQAVLARLFEHGDYSRHLYGLRHRYRAQRDAMLDGLRQIWGDACEISGAGAGMHLVLRLPADGPTASEITRRALACGVRLYPLPDAASGPANGLEDRVILFGYAALDVHEIAEATRLLKSALAAGPSTASGLAKLADGDVSAPPPSCQNAPPAP